MVPLSVLVIPNVLNVLIIPFYSVNLPGFVVGVFNPLS